MWMKNVKNYVEEAETYILNDEHTHQEIVDDGWAFFVASYLCRDPLLFCPFPQTSIPSPPSYDIYEEFYAEGLDSHEREKLLRIYDPVNPNTGLPYHFVHNASKTKVVHTGWPRFIRRMILSDVNIEHYETTQGIADITNIVVGSREEMFRVFDGVVSLLGSLGAVAGSQLVGGNPDFTDAPAHGGDDARFYDR